MRIRYARASRNDEENIRRLLVSAGNMAASAGGAGGMGSTASSGMGSGGQMPAAEGSSPAGHSSTPAHAAKGKPLIPLGAVADVRIVEGPAMIKSENGRLLNYVTLNVRGRDIVWGSLTRHSESLPRKWTCLKACTSNGAANSNTKPGRHEPYGLSFRP